MEMIEKERTENMPVANSLPENHEIKEEDLEGVNGGVLPPRGRSDLFYKMHKRSAPPPDQGEGSGIN